MSAREVEALDAVRYALKEGLVDPQTVLDQCAVWRYVAWTMVPEEMRTERPGLEEWVAGAVAK